MEELKSELLTAAWDGRFFDALMAAEMSVDREESKLREALVELNNSNQIDLISLFSSLPESGNAGSDFFVMKGTFEEVLPELEADLQSAMACVSHLHAAAGQDLSAGFVINAFLEFCNKKPSRFEEALKLIKL